MAERVKFPDVSFWKKKKKKKQGVCTAMHLTKDSLVRFEVFT
jgi:hypothetical protein